MSTLPSAFTEANRRYVMSLYKRCLKLSLDWIIRRDIWRSEAIEIRQMFDANRNMNDPRQLKILLGKAEATLASLRHPDPYVFPTAPGGSKFERNMAPPLQEPVSQHV